MALFLFRFWPVLLPLLCYMLWMAGRKKRAHARGETPPHFQDGPVYWLVLTTLLMGVLCYMAMALSIDSQKGVYAPPHMEHGVVMPGKVVP